MLNAIHELWSTAGSAIQAAVIGAFATVMAATFGALAVIAQIGRQARNAIDQSRLNEAMKLRLQVYEEVVGICRRASNAEVELSSFVRNFSMEVNSVHVLMGGGLPWSVPKARISDLLDKSSCLSLHEIELIGFVERWQVIDPRMSVIQIAINVAMHDINAAFHAYFSAAITAFPHEIPGNPGQPKALPWLPPNACVTQRLQELGDRLLDTLMTLGGFIGDIQVEMQNALVGDIFLNRAPSRAPLNPSVTVIRFDRHQELTAYFENETEWGRHKQRIEAEVLAAQSSQS